MAGATAATMNNASDVTELVALGVIQDLICSFFRGVADELRDRLFFHCRGALDLLVEFWIKSKAPHASTVSQTAHRVLQPLPHPRQEDPPAEPANCPIAMRRSGVSRGRNPGAASNRWWCEHHQVVEEVGHNATQLGVAARFTNKLHNIARRRCRGGSCQMREGQDGCSA